jgi:hypothetical protein
LNTVGSLGMVIGAQKLSPYLSSSAVDHMHPACPQVYLLSSGKQVSTN